MRERAGKPERRRSSSTALPALRSAFPKFELAMRYSDFNVSMGGLVCAWLPTALVAAAVESTTLEVSSNGLGRRRRSLAKVVYN